MNIEAVRGRADQNTNLFDDSEESAFIVTVKRRISCQQHVADDSHAPDVRLHSIRPLGNHLRSHVIWHRSQDTKISKAGEFGVTSCLWYRKPFHLW